MNKIIKAIKKYQVPGAVGDFDENNFTSQEGTVGWEGHVAGTYITGIGKIFLGMPKGFCRVGFFDTMELRIFKDYDAYNNFYPLPYNVPAWKHFYGENTLVRGLSPRVNCPFLCVILGNCLKDLNCIEISKEEIKGMD